MPRPTLTRPPLAAAARPLMLALGLAATALSALAADAPATANAPDKVAPVIDPQVERREVHTPRFPSNDFEVGAFGGLMSTQNFGSHGVGGLRLGYHITEDFFAEASLGQTKVDDATFRQVLPGGIFSTGTETLRYRDISLGWNLMPGEVFFGRHNAKASALYLIAGVGTTSFDGQRMQTASFGLGTRVFIRDWFALRADVRDHVFTMDLLGRREQTQNPELTAGFSFLF